MLEMEAGYPMRIQYIAAFSGDSHHHVATYALLENARLYLLLRWNGAEWLEWKPTWLADAVARSEEFFGFVSRGELAALDPCAQAMPVPAWMPGGVTTLPRIWT